MLIDPASPNHDLLKRADMKLKRAMIAIQLSQERIARTDDIIAEASKPADEEITSQAW